MDGKNKEREQLIRNSTAKFLIFTRQADEESIEARYEDETDWLTQKLMAARVLRELATISRHILRPT